MNHCTVARSHASNPTWQEAWRMECEARYLLSLPTLEDRREALGMNARAQRKAALMAEMTRVHKAARS